MKENVNEKILQAKDKFLNESNNFMEKIDHIKMSEFLDEIPKKLNEFSKKLNILKIYNDNMKNISNKTNKNLSNSDYNKDNKTFEIYRDKNLSDSNEKINLNFNLTSVDIKHNFSEVFESQLISRWPLFVFLFSAIICLGSSAIFHWFSALSEKWSEILARLDYAGISILIAGSCYPPYYYFFYCENLFRNGYLIFVTLLALGVFFYSFDKEFAKPHMRKIRGLLFIGLGISAGVPILHLTFFKYDLIKKYVK